MRTLLFFLFLSMGTLNSAVASQLAGAAEAVRIDLGVAKDGPDGWGDFLGSEAFRNTPQGGGRQVLKYRVLVSYLNYMKVRWAELLEKSEPVAGDASSTVYSPERRRKGQDVFTPSKRRDAGDVVGFNTAVAEEVTRLRGLIGLEGDAGELVAKLVEATRGPEEAVRRLDLLREFFFEPAFREPFLRLLREYAQDIAADPAFTEEMLKSEELRKRILEHLVAVPAYHGQIMNILLENPAFLEALLIRLQPQILERLVNNDAFRQAVVVQLLAIGPGADRNALWVQLQPAVVERLGDNEALRNAVAAALAGDGAHRDALLKILLANADFQAAMRGWFIGRLAEDDGLRKAVADALAGNPALRDAVGQALAGDQANRDAIRNIFVQHAQFGPALQQWFIAQLAVNQGLREAVAQALAGDAGNRDAIIKIFRDNGDFAGAFLPDLAARIAELLNDAGNRAQIVTAIADNVDFRNAVIREFERNARRLAVGADKILWLPFDGNHDAFWAALDVAVGAPQPPLMLVTNAAMNHLIGKVRDGYLSIAHVTGQRKNFRNAFLGEGQEANPGADGNQVGISYGHLRHEAPYTDVAGNRVAAPQARPGGG